MTLWLLRSLSPFCIVLCIFASFLIFFRSLLGSTLCLIALHAYIKCSFDISNLFKRYPSVSYSTLFLCLLKAYPLACQSSLLFAGTHSLLYVSLCFFSLAACKAFLDNHFSFAFLGWFCHSRYESQAFLLTDLPLNLFVTLHRKIIAYFYWSHTEWPSDCFTLFSLQGADNLSHSRFCLAFADSISTQIYQSDGYSFAMSRVIFVRLKGQLAMITQFLLAKLASFLPRFIVSKVSCLFPQIYLDFLQYSNPHDE